MEFKAVRFIEKDNTVEALKSDHLRNSTKWS